MAFFDDLSKSMTKLGQDVSQKTKSLTDGMKISSQLTDQKKQLAGIYETLGRAVFRDASVHDNPEYAKLVQMIESGEANVAALEEQLRQAKGGVVCKQCGADVPMGNLFCQHCGMRVEMPNQGMGGQPGGQPNQGMGGQPGGQPNQGMGGQPGGQPNQNMGQQQ